MKEKDKQRKKKSLRRAANSVLLGKRDGGVRCRTGRSNTLTHGDGRGGDGCRVRGVRRHRHGDNGVAGHLRVRHRTWAQRQRGFNRAIRETTSLLLCVCVLRTTSAPIVVVDGTVFVATMGATVAAATGVTGLKMGFWGRQIDDRAKTESRLHAHLTQRQ